MEALFLTKWYPSEANPVFGVFIREHAKAVARYANVTVLQIAGIDPGLTKSWEIRKEKNTEITGGLPTYRLYFRPSIIPKTATVYCLRSVFSAFQRISAQGRSFDIIHANVHNAALAGVLLAKRYRLPVVISEHSSAFARGMIGGLNKQKIKFAFARADRVCPVSAGLQKQIESLGIHAQFQVIPNVIDTSLFTPPEDINGVLDSQKKKLLLVALLTPVKGVDYLLEAVAILSKKRSDFVLDIVGDGSHRRTYEQMAMTLGLQDIVHFHGLKTREEVVEFMQQCDVFVLPSLIETFGIVLIEAMACGKPVVATNTSGPKEIVTEKTGALTPPGDAKALADALDVMLDRYQDYDAKSISRHVRENYSYEAVGKRFYELYQELLRQ